MHTLIVTFQVVDLSPEEFAAHCAEIAPHFAALPGLVSKVWLADPHSNTYGGVYLWASQDALSVYLGSETFRTIQASPNYTNVSARSFATIPDATAQTLGLLASGAPISV